MKTVFALLVFALPIHAADAEKLDWSKVPIKGDKDFKELVEGLQPLDKQVIILEGRYMAKTAGTADGRMVQSLVGWQVKRGDLKPWAFVTIRFTDTKKEKIEALEGKKIVIEGIATLYPNNTEAPLVIDVTKIKSAVPMPLPPKKRD